jgi:hypothetical protein
MNAKCKCFGATSADDEKSLETLEIIRETCPALKHIYLPDDVWPDFKTWHGKPDLVALHRSMLLLALERGHLDRLTSPVHRYLLDGDGVRADVTAQYRKDLRERWMHYDDAIKRHQKSRILLGKIAELQIAEWLEAQRWAVTTLEALGGGPDIEATSASLGATAFEVKAIGTEDGDFEMVLQSLAGDPAGGVVSPYSAIDYLVFRVYEVGKQLAQAGPHRVAIIVIDNGNWYRFKMQFEGNWIRWSNASFFNKGKAWCDFIKGQASRYPNLEAELAAVIKAIDAVWIVQRGAGYEYDLAIEVHPASA